jgi:hypothetical protein
MCQSPGFPFILYIISVLSAANTFIGSFLVGAQAKRITADAAKKIVFIVYV